MARPGRATRWLWLWGTAYAVLLGTVVWAVMAAQNWALRELATAKSVGEWQSWREDVRQQQGEQVPVQRRVPKSLEPPALVLMRDYFAICLVGAIVFSSLLYWVIAWFVTGILSGPRHENS